MTSEPPVATPLWAGRFSHGQHDVLQAINLSLPVDQRLFAHDIRASIAHVTMLAQQNIISQDDQTQIVAGLHDILSEFAQGTFPLRNELEDIHMNIEARLIELIGPIGGKVHTARSRNDQVVTAFRLWLRDHIDALSAETKHLIHTILDKAEATANLPMPGTTHLQNAQPITFGFHLAAYAAMFLRDVERLQHARADVNQSPLGSCALAGTSFPICRQSPADALGFDSVMDNAMDAVSARDFALSYLGACAIFATHLSRLGEELTLWSSPAYRYIKLSDRFTTGSSIMPQKRNPDAAELIRGKAATLAGGFISLLTLVKGLPLAYAKDLQDDKATVFACADTMMLSVAAANGMISDLTPCAETMLSALDRDYPTATDVADWLVRDLHMPFREAHRITGEIVKLADAKSCQLDQLTLAELQQIQPDISEDIYHAMSVQNAIQNRNSYGGTAPSRVIQALAVMREKLTKL